MFACMPAARPQPPTAPTTAHRHACKHKRAHNNAFLRAHACAPSDICPLPRARPARHVSPARRSRADRADHEARIKVQHERLTSISAEVKRLAPLEARVVSLEADLAAKAVALAASEAAGKATREHLTQARKQRGQAGAGGGREGEGCGWRRLCGAGRGQTTQISGQG